MLYDKPKYNAQLEQGEILRGVHEHRVEYPSCELPTGTKVEINSINYPYTIVLNPACDLEQDFIKARFPQSPDNILEISDYNDKELPHWMPHIILLQASDKERAIKSRIAKPDLWEQVENNDHKRYHRFEKSPIEDGNNNEVPTLYIDFKKPIALQSVGIYEGIRKGIIERLAVIPSPYIYDFIQRFHSFYSRIGVP